MYTIVTNNSLIKDKYTGFTTGLNVEYLENGTLLDVLINTRDHIHRGSRLETHPMAGSVKPNQNPYKSVMISDGKADEDEFREFITVMENCIMVCRDFLAKKALPQWPEKLKEDFRFVDLSLMDSAAERLR